MSILDLKNFLAKSTPVEKPLMSHLWESSVMAETQCKHGILRNVVEVLSDKLETDTKNIVNMICFIAAMHDIGKIHPLFQAKVGNDSDPIFDNYHIDTIYRHEVYGSNLVKEWLREKGMSSQTSLAIKDAIYMHHMGKKDNGDPWYQSEDDEGRILKIGKEIFDVFWEFYPFTDPLIKKEDWNGINILLEGALVICDWASSREDTFDNRCSDDFESFDLYLDHLRSQARDFIRVNMMGETMWNDRVKGVCSSVIPYSDVFSIKAPRPMQTALIDLLGKSGTDCPTFLLIEDICGGGKTEAAELASLLLSRGKAGVYMAMPTGATAEAMHERFENFVKFSCPDVEAPLYTSKAWLSNSDVVTDKEKSAWVTEERAKLMYPSAIGTIDQIVKYSYLMRFGQIGLVALTGKTIIIDEIHDYDSYMLESIYTLLDFCGWAGISVIACSATLSDITKRKLINAYLHLGYSKKETINVNGQEFCNHLEYPISKEYPLITAAQIKKNSDPVLYEKFASAYEKKKYKYNFVPVLEEKMSDQESVKIANLAINRIEHGGCIAISMNTVDEARSVFKACKKICGGIPVFLYLSRTSPALLDKTAKNILYYFGKKGKADNKRPFKAIVVSTPILQQSMDVDFDFMIIELRPVDALIQTLGRYRRHDNIGTIRGNCAVYDAIDILCSSVETRFQRENKIYRHSDDPNAVYKTYQYLFEKDEKEIAIPSDIRQFINTVYNNSISSKKNRSIGLIGSAYSKKHEYEILAEQERCPSCIETRIEDYPTVNIVICNKDDGDEIIKSKGLLEQSKLIRLIKENSVANVPEYLLNPFKNNPQKLDGVDIRGKLENYWIFTGDEGEIISGNKKMWIDQEEGLIVS